jgi:hypothetical protein
MPRYLVYQIAARDREHFQSFPHRQQLYKWKLLRYHHHSQWPMEVPETLVARPAKYFVRWWTNCVLI